jgi:hypothetical protein
MIPSRAGPQLIETSELPEYPFSVTERLTTHYFTAFHHDRWLNSRFRLSTAPDVRGLALDLFFLSQKQSPVGTLPDDDVQLAKLLMIDLRTWQEYRGREWSPLYKWERCLCEGEIRLMHPVVSEMIWDAIGRRDKKKAEGELGRARKRLDRLPDQILRAGGSQRMAMDADLLERVDAWLLRHCAGNRTNEWVRRALEVDSTRDGAQAIGMMR